jgi:hypothetical protein
MTDTLHPGMPSAGLDWRYHTSPDGWTGRACYSPDETYRYLVSYQWQPGNPATITWLMLNPSTATHARFDPTLRRCRDYATRWGYGGMHVLNLWAYRATDPRQLSRTPDPVGPDNDHLIDRHLDTARRTTPGTHLIVCGWGGTSVRGPRRPDRPRQVYDRLTADGHLLHCLKVTTTGQPSHPLYLPKDYEPMPALRPPSHGEQLDARHMAGIRLAAEHHNQAWVR